MIAGTYLISGILLAITGLLLGGLSAGMLTLAGSIVFFFASAGASSAYLTASEIFPMETRALCIAFFYAIGTAVGGITGPLLFGTLIGNAAESGDITGIAPGYFIGAALMIIGGIVAACPGGRRGEQVPGGHRRAAHGHRRQVLTDAFRPTLTPRRGFRGARRGRTPAGPRRTRAGSRRRCSTS